MEDAEGVSENGRKNDCANDTIANPCEGTIEAGVEHLIIIIRISKPKSWPEEVDYWCTGCRQTDYGGSTSSELSTVFWKVIQIEGTGWIEVNVDRYQIVDSAASLVGV